MTNIHGTVAPGFEPVRSALAAVAPDGDVQLAVHLRGLPVVDLWTGELDGDSLTGVYSATKGAAHLVVALLVQDGTLDLDRAVAAYWPQVAATLGELTLRGLLTHRSGLIGVDGGFTLGELADDRVIAARLAAQTPFWAPGTAYGYHALTIAALTGEVVLRATGVPMQEAFEKLIRAPHALELYMGLPAELEPRYRPVQPALVPGPPAAPGSLAEISFNLGADLAAFANTRDVRAKGQASAAGVGNARGLAGMYSAAMGSLLRPATVAAFGAPQTTGTDLVTGELDSFAVGFENEHVRFPMLAAGAFGHGGATGTQALADPAHGLAYAYVRRRFGTSPRPHVENTRLLTAVLAAVRAERR
ncbi:serine hydrolase domain-containing protein [Actinoplanes sp. NPDC051494]|uniref:serine hydrolase domain-containing protein n=1 Tax=Actinoplanes sp. NPDC051494 TaxID=3363907 RepID=UPI0037A94C81